MNKRSIDWYTLLPVLLLLSIGMIMVLSASSYMTATDALSKMSSNGDPNIDPYKYFNRQLFSVIVGLVCMYFAQKYNYRNYKGFVKFAAYLSMFLLTVVFAFPAKNGARSWIEIAGREFQPSELVKLCLILVLAKILSSKQNNLHSVQKGLLPPLIAIVVVCGLILLQPDLGSVMVIAITSYCMLFAAGVELKHLFLMAGSGVGLALVAIAAAPYRMLRLTSFLDPFKDPRGAGYQVIQSLYAIGSGGFMGVGLGQSMQKFGHIPEQHTDFIFSIISEELGFVGATIIIILFILFAARGFIIARNTRDSFGSLLAAGITTSIVVEAFVNIAVVTSTMPVTGITLPFISFGGSSLIFKLFAVGVLLNISKYSKKQALE